MSFELNHILLISQSVRNACEAYFASLNPDDPLQFVFDSQLCCMCAIASSILQEELTAHTKIHSTVITGEFDGFMHAWVGLPQNWILDITATQFKGNFPPVLLTAPHLPFYNHYKLDPTISQNLDTWITQQRATPQRKQQVRAFLQPPIPSPLASKQKSKFQSPWSHPPTPSLASPVSSEMLKVMSS